MSRRTRKRKIEVEEQKINDGEQDNFFSDEMREEIETMWEIPQIFHFLHLARESLNILQLSMYEMERMLLIPRASKQLANIMTCLLSSPITKAKLRKVPPMPYEFWTNILAHKMASWFKVYHAKHKDATKVLETIGVEPEFWNIFPDASLLDGRDFEDLSFKQRVWLLKTVCDTIMHTRKTVQEDIAKQPWQDQFETVLGIDRYGARYIYFPQFIPNDLRIYRHCVDNKILSTVKPVKSKQEMEMRKIIGARMRCRKRKSQFRSSLSDRRLNRRENRIFDKDLNSYNDSAPSSFISEDTNLSSTSTCSNNNNNISFDAISRKRTRSLSKMSEESMLSNARSSGYDTTTSNDNRSVDDESSFKGFTNTQDDNCNIGIINDMLDDLKSEIDEQKEVTKCESNNSELVTQGNIVESYKSIAGSYNETLTVEKDENERSSDNSSNNSKTDDEKLNDIISAESSKLSEGIYSKSISASDNISDSSSLTSKSDDEKLSETKTSDNVSINENSLNIKLNFNGSFCTSSSIDSASLSEKVAKHEHFSKVEVPQSMTEAGSNNLIPERNLRNRTRLRSRYKTVQHNEKNKIEDTKDETKEEVLKDEKKMDEKHFSESETRLQEKENDLDDYTNTSDYNLLSKDPKTDECKRHFNQMLSDLSISDFHLVVDSVERLKDLIASFSANDSESNNVDKVEITPLCEVKLVKKLTELLNSLEPMETILKDTMRKAKSKLQREWSNFKEGSVENQDSSSEGGLSSNWWVLGSQGRDPLSAPGDATLQTLPQSALSSLGTQSIQQQTRSAESEHRNSVKNSEQSHCESQEASDEQQNGNGEKQSDVEVQPGRNHVEEGEKQENKQHGENESASNDEDAEQQTRRVLRARGVSSYTEQFYSDDESDEDELEEWTDVEAVYAAPGAQADTSPSYATPQARHSDDWSEEEDSDQDWILPGSRKRKNKRPSANRRLKSFQHKLQSIKENTSQSNAASGVPHPTSIKIGKDKLRMKLQDNREFQEPEKQADSQVSDGSLVSSATSNKNSMGVAPATPTICKIESVNSVHSELDIKDEGPVYESGPPNHYGQNSYGSQQNYYYVMPQHSGIAGGSIMHQGAPLIQQTGTIVQGIAPPQIQQAYYVQSGAQANYVMHNSQASFLPGVQQQQQQPVFQQQSPQMIATQPYINNTNYVPYVVATTQPQTQYMIAPRPMMNQQNPIHTPRAQNRYNQNNRYATPRQSSQHLNGAVIRSSNPPVRGSCQRPINPKFVRGNVPQQRMPNPKAVQRQRTVQKQTSSAETSSGQKTTSLIVLSDSDDEIEMIITEKATTTAEKGTPADRARSASRKTINQSKQKPTITSDITVASAKGVIPPQIIQRMSQGGISITPVKNTPPPPTNANTQLVVVVNETGSHYALALPNGSKLILTPEQVAQIRASNGGKLLL